MKWGYAVTFVVARHGSAGYRTTYHVRADSLKDAQNKAERRVHRDYVTAEFESNIRHPPTCECGSCHDDRLKP